MIIWITILGVVLPMIGLTLVLPSFLDSYTSIIDTGGF
jgi:hypothetical protein